MERSRFETQAGWTALQNGLSILQPLYKKPHVISSAKLSDLMELLDYIPPIYHSFYKNLVANDDQVEEVSDSSQDESD